MKNFFLKLGVCALALTGAAEALAQEQVIQLFAHRGSRFEYDENTLPAFKASYDAGLRGFETDIRMTRDGELVISHDETLARLTPCKRVVETMTADEIRKVKEREERETHGFHDVIGDEIAHEEKAERRQQDETDAALTETADTILRGE